MSYTSSDERPPAFGWNGDGTLNEYAKLRRQAIRDAALGLPHAAIAEDRRKAGVLTVLGNPWRDLAVRYVILAPRNVGFETLRREIQIGNDGKPVKGDWEPLIDEETWREACAAILSKINNGVHRSKSLLNPLAQCGKCGARMMRHKLSDTTFSYACRPKRLGGCDSVSINGNHLDAQILDLARTYLKKRPVGTDATALRGHARRIARIQSTWLDASLDRRQTVLRQLFAAVVIKPSSRPRSYDPDRVEVIWRED